MSKITLNIVEPGGPTPTPVDPGMDTVVPNTGLFTHGIGSTEATIIVSAVLILAIVSIVLTTYIYRKHKKQNKTTKLVHIIDQTKAVIKSKKRITAGLAAISLLVSAGTFMALTKNGVNATVTDNQTEDENNNSSLTVNVSDEELTIEVGDEPVFAVLPVEVTVEEATQAGYTLTAYADNTDLVSTANSNNKIPMVTVEGDELTTLKDNTYGLALAEPEGKDSKVYTIISTDADSSTILKTTDYIDTPVEDKTTIYYGFYITPDIPYGTYEKSEITYRAEENYTTTLSFNGNGSDGGEEMASATIPAGDSTTLPPNTYTKTGYEFVGWNTEAAGTGETYTDGAGYIAEEGEFAEVMLYAQWKKLPVIGDLNYMQDFATLSGTKRNNVLGSMAQEVAYTLKDKRDEQEYTVAKLKDGNVWMTKNLNLAGGLTISSELSDVPEGYTLPIENGFQVENRLPESLQSGFNDDIKAFLYNSNETQCSFGNPCYSYYSWTTATVGSGLNVTEVNADAPYSICPKGWRLPKSRVNLGEDNSIHEFSDFYHLGVAYGMEESYSSFYVQAGPGTVSNFILSGAYRDGSLYFSGSSGVYLSATSRNDTEVLSLSLSSSYMDGSGIVRRGDGVALRCLVR